MPSLRVIVIHSPWDRRRRLWLEGMKERLQAFCVDVIEDRNKDGHWPTHRRAYELAMTYTDVSHVLFLPDDFLLAKQFDRAILGALEAVPDKPVQVFNLTKTWAEGLENNGIHWYVQRAGVTGCATAWPLETIRKFLPWVDVHVKPNWLRWEDSHLALWLNHGCEDHDVWVTVPSLAQHLGAQFSVAQASNRNKIASTFLGNTPADEIDWTVPAHVPRHSPMVSSEHTKAAYVP